MIFESPRCPACQRYADRIVEKVYAKIELGLVTLQCRCGRHWKTLMVEE